MNGQALVMMIAAEGIVIGFAAFFFWKVLNTPPKPEPDSYSENDKEPR
jgi:hypothetical protein